MEEQYNVYWNGTHVGVFEIVEMDMWVNEGPFIPLDSPVAHEFTRLSKGLDIKKVFMDFSEGIPCKLHPNTNPDAGWNATVLGYIEDTFVVRRIC